MVTKLSDWTHLILPIAAAAGSILLGGKDLSDVDLGQAYDAAKIAAERDAGAFRCAIDWFFDALFLRWPRIPPPRSGEDDSIRGIELKRFNPTARLPPRTDQPGPGRSSRLQGDPAGSAAAL